MEWPNRQALLNCIDWNRTEQRRAERDVKDAAKVVPKNAIKWVREEHRMVPVPLTLEEWREARTKDAARFGQNAERLVTRL
jgi:hypothetical protein